MKMSDVMPRVVQLRFDYTALDSDTRRFVEERAERIHNLARMTAAGIVQIGQYLTEVKARMPRRFLDWIEKEFSWSQPSAWRFMNVFEQFKLCNLNNLEIDVSALYLIAAPSTPEPVRQEAFRRAENGEAVTHAGTRALIERFAESGEIPDLAISLPQMIAERRRLEAPDSTPPPMSAAERAEQKRLRQEREANTARVAEVMGVIEAIDHIAQTPLSAMEIADQIDRWDTPDKDWHGKTKEASTRLRQLSKEFKL
jgi:hypothetical protein